MLRPFLGRNQWPSRSGLVFCEEGRHRATHWLKVNERIEYQRISLTYKDVTTSQPSYLHNLISLRPPCNTRYSSVKGKGLDSCCSATYMSQTRDQQRFTISEVAADWHEPMVLQRIMWPFIARPNAPISHTRPSSRSRSYNSFPVPLRVGG